MSNHGCTDCPHLYRESTDFGVNCFCCHPTRLSDDNEYPRRPSVKFIGHHQVLDKRPDDCPLKPEGTE